MGEGEMEEKGKLEENIILKNSKRLRNKPQESKIQGLTKLGGAT